MTYPVPGLGRHANRPTTARAAARSFDRIVANLNNPTQSDVVNPAPSAVNVAAHSTSLSPNTPVAVTGPATAILAWPTVEWDTDGWWSSGSNTRITVVTAGIYLVNLMVECNLISQPVLLTILKNGGTLVTQGVGTDPTNGQGQFTMAIQLAGGDYIQAQVSQTSGTVTYSSCRFQLSRLGTQ